VPIRPFRRSDIPALVSLSADCSRGEADFVLNPYWEEESDLDAEFARLGIGPEEHLLVADAGEGDVQGLVGFLRGPGAHAAGMFCPIVRRGERGRGLGGELLRAALARGPALGIGLLAAGVGTRNRAGYSLLTSHGFRPVRQVFLMRCDRSPRSAAPPEGLHFEPAREGDADAILSVYATCGFEPRSADAMRAALTDGRHDHAVARQDGRVVAFAELETHWPRRPWVAYAGVEKPLRDRGVGSALVSYALARRFEEGAASGQLMLSPANRTALRAYEKVGFRRFRLIDVLEKSL
jgi:ribosomal protein S18 acetylase RimI-like enzyme